MLLRSRQGFERAIGLCPVHAYYHVGLARVLADLAREKLAEPAKSFAEYDCALALETTNPYYFTDAANAALVLNDLSRAREYAARGLSAFPSFGPLQAHMGYISIVENHRKAGAEWLRGAMAADWHGDDAGRQFAAAKLAELTRADNERHAARP